MNVTFNQNPTTSVAGPDQTGASTCGLTTITLAANTPAIGTGLWTIVSGTGGSFANASSPTTTFSGTAGTPYVLAWTISKAPCAGSSSTMNAIFNLNPTAVVAADTTICSGNTATLTATAPGGTYNWYDAATGGTLLATGLTYTSPVLNSTTTYYTDATSAAGCKSVSRTPVTVTVNPTPVAPVVSAVNICQGYTGTLSATAPGGTYNWYASVSGGSSLGSGSTFTSPVLNAETTYYVDATSGAGCTGPRQSATVSVTPTDNPAFHYASGTYCVTGTNPAAIRTGGSTGTFSSSPAGLLFINSSTGLINLSGSTVGTYTVKFVTNGTCIDSSAVSITLTTAPEAGFSFNGPYCQKQGNPAPVFNPGASAGLFSATPAGLVFVSTSSGEIDLSSSAAGTYTITNSIAAEGGCATASAFTTVVINAAPFVNAGPDQTICSGHPVTMAGTMNGGTTSVIWSGGLGSFSNPSLLNAVYTPAATETNATLYLRSNAPASPCTIAIDSMNIVINPTPTAPIASGGTICQGYALKLTASDAVSDYKWYSASTGGSLLALTASYTTPVLNSTTTYYAEDTLGGCISSLTPVTVTVIPTDNPAFNYASATFCITGANPVATITGGFTGTFSSSPAGLVFTSTTTGEINMVASSLGTYNITYTTDGPCPASSSVSLTLTNSPNASFSYPENPYCQRGAAPVPAYVSGASAGVFSASPSGLVFVNTSTGIVNLSLSTPGTYTVTNTIAASGGCASASASALLTIDLAPTVKAGPDQTICAGSSATLAGSIGGSATSATWSGAGSFSDPTVLNAVYTPTPAEVTAGQAKLILTTNRPAGPCNAFSDTITVFIHIDNPSFSYSGGTFCVSGSNPTPDITGLAGGTFSSAPAGLAFVSSSTGVVNLGTTTLGTYTITYTTNGSCPNSETNSLTVTTAPDAGFSYSGPYCQKQSNPSPVFTPGSSAGLFSAVPSGLVFVSASSGEINLSASAAGTYTVTNSIPASGGCAAASASTTVVINPAPFVSAGPNQIVCSGNPVNLAGSMSGATTSVTWSGGLGSFSNPSLLNAIYTPAAGETKVKLYLRSNTPLSPCTSALDSMNIVINPTPAAPAASGGTICMGNSLVLTASDAVADYKWYSAASTGTVLALTASFTTPVLNTSTTYYVEDTLGGCSSQMTSVNITVLPTDKPSFTYSSSTFCATGSNPDPTISGGYTGSFSSAPAGLVFSSTSTGAINLSASSLGTYTITFTTDGQCPASTSEQLTISNALNAAFSYAASPYCQRGANPSPSFAAGASAGLFSASPAGLVFVSNAAGVVNISLSAPGTYTVTNTIAASGGCASTVATGLLTIATAPAVDAGPDQTICSGSSATLAGSIGGSASSATWSGAGSFSDATALNAVYTPTPAEVTAGQATLILTTNRPAGPCAAFSDTMTVFIHIDNPSFSYSGGTFCVSGSNPTPDITGLAGGTFSSAPAGLVFVSPSTGVVNLGATTPGTYTITYTTNGSCPNSDTHSLTITTTPDASFTYATPFCEKGSNPLPAFVSGSSAGIFSASPAGLIFVNASTGEINLSASAAGTYTVTNTIAASGGCSAAASTSSVTLIPPATVNAGPDQSGCEGSSVNLAGSVSGSASGAIWTGGLGTFSPNNSTLNAVYIPAAGETSATLILTSDSSAGSCNVARDTLILTFRTHPAAPNVSDTTICSGTTATLSTTDPTGTIQWFNSATGGTAIFSGPAFTTPVLVATTTYYVQSTVSGCVSAVRTPATVNVNALPDASFTYTSPFCKNNSNPLPLFGSGSSAGVFSASPAGLVFVSATSGEIALASSAAGTYVVTNTITGSGVCASAISSYTVTIIPFATANAGSDQTLCSYDIISLSGSVGEAQSEFWKTLGSGLFSPDSTNLNITYVPGATDISNGSVKLILVSANNCGFVSDTVLITIGAKPVASFATSAGTYTAGESISFVNNSKGSSAWVWNFGDNAPVSDAQDPTHSYKLKGDYTISLIASSSLGCLDTASQLITIEGNSAVNGSSTPAVPSAFTPNGDHLNDILVVRGGPFQEIDFRIFNEWGNELFRSEAQTNGWDGTLNGKAQAQGVYVWTLTGVMTDGQTVKMAGNVTLMR